MNLVAKLDRLRARPGEAADAALAVRLKRSRVGVSTPEKADTTASVLGQALLADRQLGDLLICEREVRLPPGGVGASDLVQLPEVCELHMPDWVYIDTETTGLSSGVGNMAFMVGVARHVGDQLLGVRQYVLGSFAAETRMLHDLVDWIGRDAVLVSFNGKCFDLPLLGARCRLRRIDDGFAGLRHLDLMYTVRRAFRRRWPDCRLQTAERRLLKLYRQGDLPGDQAPVAWQRWLRSGETAMLAAVLRHNYQDVVSLALLQRQLVIEYAGRGDPAADRTRIGRAWRDVGQADLARRIWEGTGKRLDADGQLELAALYRRRGDWSRAESLWLSLHARGNTKAASELSKYYEHRRRDFGRAIDFAGHCDQSERDSRLRRLQGKLAATPQLPLWPTVGALNRGTQ
jgi:uncharacterized protein YprB with RNaseH-like and TPR domain